VTGPPYALGGRDRSALHRAVQSLPVTAPPPLFSIIVPAHNEEVLLPATLAALRVALRALDGPGEIIVVDDASTDRTGEIGTSEGATLIRVDARQIAAARNAGARTARGTFLVFVDADTIVPPDTLRAAIAALRVGAVGGGATPVFEPSAPRWAHRAIGVTIRVMRLANWAAGCFIFAEREAFLRAGGFDERFFASEEIHLSRALKRQGRFVILREQVLTSARKAHHYSLSRSVWLFLRLARPGSLRRREGLDFWYTRHHK
jgi:glycosyltransferase involved in cell wall biosynthesis